MEQKIHLVLFLRIAGFFILFGFGVTMTTHQ